jgi:hypothetical protein
MGYGLAIRADVARAAELRRLAKKELRRRTAQRMLAIANAMEGMSRADAARAAGIERQSCATPSSALTRKAWRVSSTGPTGAGPSG